MWYSPASTSRVPSACLKGLSPLTLAEENDTRGDAPTSNRAILWLNGWSRPKSWHWLACKSRGWFRKPSNLLINGIAHRALGHASALVRAR